MKAKFLFIVCFVIFAAFGFAQVKTDSAKEDFEDYERGGIGESTPTPTRTPKIPQGGRITPTPKPSATPIRRVGKRGMKIWFERQIGCDKTKSFRTVAPTTAFSTGDCVRVKFQLNFLGYLTIVNIGTSGKRNDIFPDTDQSNEISPRTTYYLPKKGAWKFQGNPGNEQLIFIVSKSLQKKPDVDNSVKDKEITEKSPDLEAYDRDIVAVTEDDEVYVLGDETKFEDAIVFRITLKHR